LAKAALTVALQLWGSITMVEHNTQFRSYVPDLDEFDEDLISSQPATYQLGRSGGNDYSLAQAVPLFLSDPDGEPDPEEFVPPPRHSRLVSVTSKFLIVLVVAGSAAAAVAWFSPDAARSIIANAKASIATVSAAAAAKADDRQLTAADIQLQDPARVTAPPAQAAHASQPPEPAPVELASVAPTREEISSAYQAALRNAAPADAAAQAAPAAPAAIAAPIAPPAAAPAPQVRRIDRDELATLMKRAKDFLETGDIPAARLLLERAAEEGQDATAALLLARTYDPVVLGTSDVRNITAEPEQARAWYRKAAQFGSAEAQQRLAQLDH
jgi:TPR repeat protein